jgi:hypothetical protein
VFEEKMPDPSETVTAKQRALKPDRSEPTDHHRRDDQQYPGAADEMQTPTGSIGVLGKVVRIKIAEVGESSHGVSWFFVGAA